MIQTFKSVWKCLNSKRQRHLAKSYWLQRKSIGFHPDNNITLPRSKYFWYKTISVEGKGTLKTNKQILKVWVLHTKTRWKKIITKILMSVCMCINEMIWSDTMCLDMWKVHFQLKQMGSLRIKQVVVKAAFKMWVTETVSLQSDACTHKHIFSF